MGISVIVEVMLMHLQSLRCKRKLYVIFQEKEVHYMVWKML